MFFQFTNAPPSDGYFLTRTSIVTGTHFDCVVIVHNRLLRDSIMDTNVGIFFCYVFMTRIIIFTTFISGMIHKI